MLLSARQFFGEIFIDSYVCALHKDDSHQFGGIIATDYCSNDESVNSLFEKSFFTPNKEGHGIHFTPNGIKSIEERNRKANFSHINAWYLDVDIESTKEINDESDRWRRDEVKEKILAKVFSLEILPSLTVETRNGFHLYWFALPMAKVENFDFIQNRLMSLFSEFGEEVPKGILATLRVPYFWYSKNGETGQILPVASMSTLQLNKEEDMMAWLQGVKPFIHPRNAGKGSKINNVKPADDLLVHRVNLFNSRAKKQGIFTKFKNLPVMEVLEKLSGHSGINNDVLTFLKTADGKYNVLAGGKITPNWIDIKTNNIFSNNQAHFSSIIDFLMWYGHDNKKIAHILLDLSSSP